MLFPLIRKWDLTACNLPAIGLEGFDKRFDALTVMVRKDDSHNHLKVMQRAQLGNNGSLELPEGGSSVTIPEPKEMDQVFVNLGRISWAVNVIPHLVPTVKDSVAHCELTKKIASRFILVAGDRYTKWEIARSDYQGKVPSAKGVHCPTKMQDLLCKARNLWLVEMCAPAGVTVLNSPNLTGMWKRWDRPIPSHLTMITKRLWQ